MMHEKITNGLLFAARYELTKKEIKTLIPFFEKPYTTKDLANILGVSKKTLHFTINILKLKGLIVMSGKRADNNFVYELNTEALK